MIWIALSLLAVWVWRKPFAFPLTLLAVLLGETISRALKLVIDRQRPAFHFREPPPLMHIPRTDSFPSGHATTSFAAAATLARFAPSRSVAVALYVLAALIAWSRVYVGAHYPLDVLAGALLGLAIARALRPLPEVLQRSRRAPPAG